MSSTSNHLHPLQVENCDNNSRLVVDEDDNGKFKIKRVKKGHYPETWELSFINLFTRKVMTMTVGGISLQNHENVYQQYILLQYEIMPYAIMWN